jgi:ligand-binding sensor domain-containing protein
LQSSVTCILQDRKGFLWFGTYDGLNKYDGYGFTIYKHEALDSNSLSYNGISSLCEDRAGNLWIGTAGGGLNKLDRAQEQFTRFVNDPKNPYSLSHNQVTSLHEDRTGNLWIGTFGGGLNKFDRVTERFTRLVNDPKNPYSLSHNQVTSIYEDRSDNLWIGTAGGGLNKIVASTSSEQVPSTSEKLNNPDSAAEEFKVKSGRFIHFVNDPKNPNSLSSNDVRAIFEDPLLPNTLWIGTRDGGLNKLVVPRQNHSDASLKNAYEKSGQFTCYLNDPKNPFSLGVNEVRAIFADSSSNALWVGTFGGGLNRFDYATARFIRLVNAPNDPASLSDNRVLSIYQTSASRNILWIGTQGGGLNRIVFEKKPFTHFTNDPKNPHRLCNNRVWAIHQDRAGMLWIGTQEGLNQFNRESGEWTCFANDPKILTASAITMSAPFMKATPARFGLGLMAGD